MKKFIEEVTIEAKALKVKISEDIDDIKIIFNVAALKELKDKAKNLTVKSIQDSVKSGANSVVEKLKAIDSEKVNSGTSKFINGTVTNSKRAVAKFAEMKKGDYESTGLNFIVSSAKSVSHFLTLSEFNNQVKKNHTLKVGLAVATVGSLATSIMLGNPIPYILTKTTFNYKLFNDLIKHHKKENWTNSAGQTLTSSIALRRYLNEQEDVLIKLNSDLEEKMAKSSYTTVYDDEGNRLSQEKVEENTAELEMDKLELVHRFNKTLLKADRLSKFAKMDNKGEKFQLVSMEGLKVKRPALSF